MKLQQPYSNGNGPGHSHILIGSVLTMFFGLLYAYTGEGAFRDLCILGGGVLFGGFLPRPTSA